MGQIKYLGKPLYTVSAKEADRKRLAEAMARFGHVQPAPEIDAPLTPAQRRVASWKK